MRVIFFRLIVVSAFACVRAWVRACIRFVFVCVCGWVAMWRRRRRRRQRWWCWLGRSRLAHTMRIMSAHRFGSHANEARAPWHGTCNYIVRHGLSANTISHEKSVRCRAGFICRAGTWVNIGFLLNGHYIWFDSYEKVLSECCLMTIIAHLTK